MIKGSENIRYPLRFCGAVVPVYVSNLINPLMGKLGMALIRHSAGRLISLRLSRHIDRRLVLSRFSPLNGSRILYPDRLIFGEALREDWLVCFGLVHGPSRRGDFYGGQADFLHLHGRSLLLHGAAMDRGEYGYC